VVALVLAVALIKVLPAWGPNIAECDEEGGPDSVVGEYTLRLVWDRALPREFYGNAQATHRYTGGVVRLGRDSTFRIVTRSRWDRTVGGDAMSGSLDPAEDAGRYTVNGARLLLTSARDGHRWIGSLQRPDSGGRQLTLTSERSLERSVDARRSNRFAMRVFEPGKATYYCRP
jgi:hypothetical protein